MKKKIKKLSFIINISVWGFIFSFAIFSAFLLVSLEDLRGISILENYKPPIVTKILDVKGRVISEFYRERRKVVDYKDISKKIVRATVSIEDKRFLQHYGVDLVRIIKAILINMSSMKKEQGGSTITIQLSKLIFLDHKKTYQRKIKELWYAFQIEKQYTKKEIINFYLNQINYGHGGFGVEAASQFYFEKSAKNLNVAESALLAGLPNSPYYYSPIRFPMNSQMRHRTVLTAMVNNKMLNPELASLSYLEFWMSYGKQNRNIQETFGQLSENKAPYFTEYIRNKIGNDIDEGAIYEKGLVVYTTLNLDHQIAAKKYIHEKLEEQKKISENLEKRLPETTIYNLFQSLSHQIKTLGIPKIDFERNLIRKRLNDSLEKIYPSIKNFTMNRGIKPPWLGIDNNKIIEQNKPQAALISIEPSTGNITAMVGGSGFNYNNQFNRAINLKRQVGSIIKPFIYAVAIDKNHLRPSTILNDAPKSFNGYIPKNYSQKFKGEITVRDALRKSINVLAVETLDKVGIDIMRKELAGIFRTFTEKEYKERFPNNLTMALGSGSFSPLTFATAYAVLANDGVEVIPHTIRYITDGNGSIIKNYEVELLSKPRKRLIDHSTAFIIKDIISDVFQPGGTAYNYQLLKDFRHWKDSFGKTGTTSNWKDAWFAGANSYLSTVVWFGYDDNKSLGRGRTGGRVAAPVWINFNKEILDSRPIEESVKPNDVVQKKICLDCDGLAGPYCPNNRVRLEFYKIDNYPEEICKTKGKNEEEAKQFIGVVKKINQSERPRENLGEIGGFLNLVNKLGKKKDKQNFYSPQSKEESQRIFNQNTKLPLSNEMFSGSPDGEDDYQEE